MDLEFTCIECGGEYLADVWPEHGMCPDCAEGECRAAYAELAGDIERDEK
jgi:hypothetical protein